MTSRPWLPTCDLSRSNTSFSENHLERPVNGALALSRTQDDKGRIRWTLFGASDHGAARPFFRTKEPLNEFFERLLLRVYGERSISGFRVHNRSDRSLTGEGAGRHARVQGAPDSG